MNTTLLLDSDIIAYKFAAAAQSTVDWGDGEPTTVLDDFEMVMYEVEDYMQELKEKLMADSFIVCLSCPSDDNWRKKVLPSYKENRAGVAKPLYLSAIKNQMRSKHECFERPTLEADDIMGILSTHPKLVKGKKIIVSEDKDMKTIPGWLFNPRKDEQPRHLDHYEANYWHMYQTLIGDATDNYKGCPGIGPKRAEKILEGLPMDEFWGAVKLTYEYRGSTEEEALVQARVSRICRDSDYDFKSKEVILWQP